jgi:hypothetical protein
MPIQGPTSTPSKQGLGGARKGPGVKNVQSSRRSKPSNAGRNTGPIKGPDKGRG